jgi:nicotinamide mononucleotide transporter
MESIQTIFSVKTIFFEIFNYPISYIEFFGTILYLLSVLLIAQKNILTWPVGIISVILYGMLFYQIQLYSDTVEQVYYLGASIYGWIYWNKNKEETSNAINFRYSSLKVLLTWSFTTIILSLFLTIFMMDVHNLIPEIFPSPASFPFLDALTTIMSFVAMFLMAQKRIESWVYWIIIDIIGIILYFVKDVKFISILYLFLLVIAVRGFIKWHNDSLKENRSEI